jgi:DNA-binding IscR family transcriptional regulator
MMMISALSTQRRVNSDFVSESTGVNAVIIRNIFSQLKKANLITVSPGPGGTTLSMSPEKISLWDIYAAVESEKTEDIFKFHENPSPYCPVGSNIYDLLFSHLDDAVNGLKDSLSCVTLADLLNELFEKLPNLAFGTE